MHKDSENSVDMELLLLRNLEEGIRQAKDNWSPMVTDILTQLENLREGVQTYPEQVYVELFHKLERRRLIGLEAYKRRLVDDPNRLTAWLEEAIAEVLDLSVYLAIALKYSKEVSALKE